jgi:hypothetical protein
MRRVVATWFAAAYRGQVKATERRCALCGDPIEPDQASMTAGDGEEAAHSGCVYRDADQADRDRWMPPEV